MSTVSGSALGYHAYNLTLFGSSQPEQGPAPAVTLASNASNSPQLGSVSTALVTADVATLFTSDEIDVTAMGAVGQGGYSYTTVTINHVNKATTQPSTGSEVLTADALSSACQATESALSAATTVSNGTLQTDSGWDGNGNGSYADPGDVAPVVVTLPSSPAVNTAYDGIIRLSATAAPDTFRIVFNEQVVGTGSMTVNAAHEYLGTTQASRLKGDMILGQSQCGIS